MGKQKRLTADEVIKILRRNGFAMIAHKATSHQKWKNQTTGHVVIVPMHKGPLPIGTLMSIITGSGLERDLFN